MFILSETGTVTNANGFETVLSVSVSVGMALNRIWPISVLCNWPRVNGCELLNLT